MVWCDVTIHISPCREACYIIGKSATEDSNFDEKQISLLLLLVVHLTKRTLKGTEMLPHFRDTSETIQELTTDPPLPGFYL